MPIEKEQLESLILNAFADAEVEVTDLAGDNDHWQVVVISTDFEGKNRIEQHKMVQEAVKGHNIHALSIKTITPGL